MKQKRIDRPVEKERKRNLIWYDKPTVVENNRTCRSAEESLKRFDEPTETEYMRTGEERDFARVEGGHIIRALPALSREMCTESNRKRELTREFFTGKTVGRCVILRYSGQLLDVVRY